GILPDEAMGRIERGGGTLGHVGDAGSADTAHLRFRRAEAFLPVEDDGIAALHFESKRLVQMVDAKDLNAAPVPAAGPMGVMPENTG
ncbi:MAG: hypothetical protein KFF68_14335, partial [Desulfosarcina sp.]|nr:hypothetical protein [Desulfosarcina sp.]